MTDTPSYDVGDQVIFTEITFSENGDKEHPGTITEVLRPQEYYNIRGADGRDWTVAAGQIRRADS